MTKLQLICCNLFLSTVTIVLGCQVGCQLQRRTAVSPRQMPLQMQQIPAPVPAAPVPDIHIHEGDVHIHGNDVSRNQPGWGDPNCIGNAPADMRPVPDIQDAPFWPWDAPAASPPIATSDQQTPPFVDTRPDSSQVPITVPHRTERDPTGDGDYTFMAWMRRLYRLPLWLKLLLGVTFGVGIAGTLWPFRVEVYRVAKVIKNADLSDGITQEAEQIRDIAKEAIASRKSAAAAAAVPKKAAAKKTTKKAGN